MASELYQAICQTSSQIIKFGTFTTWQGQLLQKTYQLSTYLCLCFVQPKLFPAPEITACQGVAGWILQCLRPWPKLRKWFWFQCWFLGLFEQIHLLWMSQLYASILTIDKRRKRETLTANLFSQSCFPKDAYSQICPPNSKFPAIGGWLASIQQPSLGFKATWLHIGDLMCWYLQVGKPWDARQNDMHHLWCDARHGEPITMLPGGVWLQ